MKRLILMLVTLFICQCAVDRQTENYRPNSIADLTLSQDNHLHGYGKSECFFCHLPQNMHQVNRLNAPNFDLAKGLIEQSGLASCAGCHGTNGVSP